MASFMCALRTSLKCLSDSLQMVCVSHIKQLKDVTHYVTCPVYHSGSYEVSSGVTILAISIHALLQ